MSKKEKAVLKKIIEPSVKAQGKMEKLGITRLAGKLAKRDFVIHQNEFHFEIKRGEDLSEIPERFYQNLKTEGVI